jgi:hypothetical protein
VSASRNARSDIKLLSLARKNFFITLIALRYRVIIFKYLNEKVQQTKIFIYSYQVYALFFIAIFRQLVPFYSSRKKVGKAPADFGSTETALSND